MYIYIYMYHRVLYLIHHIHTYIHTYTYTYIYIYIHIYTYTYIYIYIHVPQSALPRTSEYTGRALYLLCTGGEPCDRCVRERERGNFDKTLRNIYVCMHVCVCV